MSNDYDDYYDEDYQRTLRGPPAVPYTRQYNPRNPDNEPTGHFTGRCKKCGSRNLWDDNLAYGCNDCGAFLGGNN